jgi:hypothetical protein
LREGHEHARAAQKRERTGAGDAMILNAEDKRQRDLRERNHMRDHTLKTFHEDEHNFFRRAGIAEATDEEILIWDALPADSELFDQFFDHLQSVCAKRRKERGIPEPEIPLKPEDIPVDPKREAEVKKVDEQVAAHYGKKKQAAESVHNTLVESMRAMSATASREHQREHPDEAIVFALKSEKVLDTKDVVRLLISKSWFDTLTRDLLFWHKSWKGGYRRDAAGHPEMIHRVVKGALFCDVTFNNGDHSDLRVKNLTIHRGGHGDGNEARYSFMQSKSDRVMFYDLRGEMPPWEGGPTPEEREG